MNDRIKELAMQAFESVQDTDPDSENWFLIYSDRFAELIVRECADRLKNEADQYDLLDGREVSAQTMETAVAILLKHFGVK